jgi:hypothetical protein
VDEQNHLIEQGQREAREAWAEHEQERHEADLRDAPRAYAEHCFYQRRQASRVQRPRRRARARGAGRPAGRRVARQSGSSDDASDDPDESDALGVDRALSAARIRAAHPP